ncbi:single-stranded DNA-binding protein [Vaginisenegalia massiliensis]|uniref:single-stranded DNA-binding protein n=1 Tax=Vaginisenegalia massiliensis TaxID=2058294 RepID=UPI000F520B86|nr:single-stranded DNA-binding protein [Vaginisenegalia massiliensis]
MNQVFFVGRIVRPIELKLIGPQHRVVNNTLAVSRNRRDKEGRMMTDFIPVIAWDHVADLLDRFCEKGQRIAVVGRMQSRTYTNHDQQSVFVVECVINEITLLDRMVKDEQGQEAEIHYDPHDLPEEDKE